MKANNLLFASIVVLSTLLWARPLHQLAELCGWNSRQAYAVLVLPVAIALIWKERTKVFRRVALGSMTGSFLIGSGLALAIVLRALGSSQLNLTLGILSLVVIWVGAFTFGYGGQAAVAAKFPLAIMFLIIPFPKFSMDWLIIGLQQSSTWTADLLLRLLGIPFYREGFLIESPGRAIEITDECSGIRAALFLLFLSILAAHLYLRGTWWRILLISLALPVAALKNGLRIFTLIALDAYIDPTTFEGWLHRYGGIPFFILSMILLYLLIRLFRWCEGKPCLSNDLGWNRVGSRPEARNQLL